MRTYKILAARAKAFDADPEVRALIAESEGVGGKESRELGPMLRKFTRGKAAELRAMSLDPEALGARGLRYERLDQVMMEHLMGVRG
jgi:xylose isomerase